MNLSEMPYAANMGSFYQDIGFQILAGEELFAQNLIDPTLLLGQQSP